MRRSMRYGNGRQVEGDVLDGNGHTYSLTRTFTGNIHEDGLQ